MSRPPQTNLFVRAGGVFFVLFFMTVESARSQVGALASTVGTLRELAKNHGKYIGPGVGHFSVPGWLLVF